jgi:hypothetical protein
MLQPYLNPCIYGAMIVKIHDIAASCIACRGGDFQPLSSDPLGPGSMLKCSACGATYDYLELIDQVGEEAMSRANKALDERRKKKPQD